MKILETDTVLIGCSFWQFLIFDKLTAKTDTVEIPTTMLNKLIVRQLSMYHSILDFLRWYRFQFDCGIFALISIQYLLHHVVYTVQLLLDTCLQLTFKHRRLRWLMQSKPGYIAHFQIQLGLFLICTHTCLTDHWSRFPFKLRHSGIEAHGPAPSHQWVMGSGLAWSVACRNDYQHWFIESNDPVLHQNWRSTQGRSLLLIV